MSRRSRTATGAGGHAAAPSAGAAAFGVLLLLLACSPAQAQLPWYHVEVVVVAQGDEGAWQRNNWREEGPAPLGENTVELLVGSAPGEGEGGSKRRHAFRRLPASRLDLGAAVDRLERSGDYRVLLHVGWRQPGFPFDDAPGVHLVTPRRIGAGNRLRTAAAEGVDGTVRLWRRRFLHVDADLAFGDVNGWRERLARESGGQATRNGRPPRDSGSIRPESRMEVATGSPPAAPDRLRVVRLTRSLRLQEGRLHYVDHPLFGVLLLARRLG